MTAPGDRPYEGRQAAALAPHIGKWVALDEDQLTVLVARDTPTAVIAWLRQHPECRSYGMFRVPLSVAEAEGAAPL